MKATLNGIHHEIITTKEQVKDFAYQVDPVDPWAALDVYTDEELEAKFPAFAIVEIEVNGGEVYRYTANHVAPGVAEDFVNRIETRGSVNLSYWTHLRTVYGSEAYQRNDVDGQIKEMEYDARRGGTGYESPDAYEAANLWKCM